MDLAEPHLRAPQRRPITVDEYYRMAETGILGPDERVELIEGEIIETAPISSDHAGVVNALADLLFEVVGKRALVTVQNPVLLNDTSEPVPDFAVLKRPDDYYRSAHPGPADVLLVIEVAKSSLRYDRDRKAPLYARHGIPEYWIADVEARLIHVFRDPNPDGYATHRQIRPGETLDILALPGVAIPAATVLGT